MLRHSFKHLRYCVRQCSSSAIAESPSLSFRQKSSRKSSITLDLHAKTLAPQRNTNSASSYSQSEFNYSFLRANCQCEACKHPTSGQRLVSISELPNHLEVDKLNQTNDELHISWKPDGHQSAYKWDWLKEHCYSSTSLSPRMPTTASRVSDIPVVDYKELLPAGNSEPATAAAAFSVLHNVFHSGICILNNVPCKNESVKAVAESLGPISHPFLYGETFDVKPKADAENIAYTANELKLHLDLAYYESPPGIQMLHCMQLDDAIKGGESIFLDVFKAAERLRSQDPEAFETLTRVPATFTKHHTDRENPALMDYQRPHIQVNHRQEVVAVYWSPPFEGPLRVPFEDVDPYYRAYKVFEEIIQGAPGESSDLSLEFRLNAGDLVLFNQRRLLHSRNKFTSTDPAAVRHLRGTYLNIDESYCRYRVLGKKLNYPESYCKVHIANGSF